MSQEPIEKRIVVYAADQAKGMEDVRKMREIYRAVLISSPRTFDPTQIDLHADIIGMYERNAVIEKAYEGREIVQMKYGSPVMPTKTPAPAPQEQAEKVEEKKVEEKEPEEVYEATGEYWARKRNKGRWHDIVGPDGRITEKNLTGEDAKKRVAVLNAEAKEAN